jgi:glycerate dehydrogenase
VLATGYNVVDVVAAKERGIVVTNVPAYSTDSVAQHTIALMLEGLRGISAHATAARKGKWSAGPDFCLTVGPIREVTGLTLGIVGMGVIGQSVARIAAAMGMRIAAARKEDKEPSPGGLPGLGTARL